jgi:cytochrome oxidase assembly protein ShyY1
VSVPWSRVAVAVTAALVAAVCVRLGFWQLSRLEERRTTNAAIRSGLAAPPEALTGAPASAGYRRVTASGTYDDARTLVLYGRPRNGAPGNHVLTPLRLPDGSGVLVDRGWVPSGGQTEDVPLPPTPTGSVEVAGVLLPGAQDGRLEGRTVDRVDLDTIGAELPYPIGQGYLLLRRQVPASRSPVPAALPPLDEGPHLSYAIQWFSFGGIALVGGGVLLRRTRRRPGR